MAAAIIAAIRRSWNHSAATPPMTTAHSMPLSAPTANSLLSSQPRLLRLTCPKAMPRITTVSVWLPATPPMLATMGINMASATTFSIVASKILMTEEARMAVIRLTPSQTARRGAVRPTEAKVPSSSLNPAMLSREWSASSMMTSTTSSMVMRPNNFLLSLITGAETQSCFSNRCATSESCMSAEIVST